MNEFPGYEASHEEFMRLYCRSLPEDHRRRYAALEALKIGFGGIAYVSRVLGMSRCTIYTGIRELEDNKVDPATGTIRARAVLDNRDRVFTPGLFARVKLLGSSRFRALLVDDKAILTDQDRKYAYVLGPENRALRRDVKLGRRVEGLRMVTEGLAPGDHVIVYGCRRSSSPACRSRRN